MNTVINYFRNGYQKYCLSRNSRMDKSPLFTSAILAILFAFCFSLALLLSATPASAAMTGLNITAFTDKDNGAIQVVANNSALVMCYGNATSTTGVTGVNATFYGPSSTYKTPPAAGTAYRNTSCTVVGTTSATYNCTTVLHHHAEPGNWSCLVVARDLAGNRNLTKNNTLNTFLSFSMITTKLNFSKTTLNGGTGTTDYLVQFNNTGNVAMHIQIDAYRLSGNASDADAMACSVGVIPVGNMKYAEVPGQDVSIKTALTDTPITTTTSYSPTAFGNTAYTNGTLYYGLIIPSSAVQGKCNGILSITAVP